MGTLHAFLVGMIIGYIALRLERKQALVLAAAGLASTPLFIQENQPAPAGLAGITTPEMTI